MEAHLGSLPYFLDCSSLPSSTLPSPRLPQSTKASPTRPSFPFADKFGVKGNYLYENVRVDVGAQLRKLVTQGAVHRPNRRKKPEIPGTNIEPEAQYMSGAGDRSVTRTRGHYTRNKLL